MRSRLQRGVGNRWKDPPASCRQALHVSRMILVPKAGLEPARLSPHAPQTCVSAIPPLRHLRHAETPFNFVLGRRLHCGRNNLYASFAGSLRPCSRAFERA